MIPPGLVVTPPCSEEAAVCPWCVLLLEDCPGARFGEQMLSNLLQSASHLLALGRAGRADVPGNWKVQDDSRAA